MTEHETDHEHDENDRVAQAPTADDNADTSEHRPSVRRGRRGGVATKGVIIFAVLLVVAVLMLVWALTRSKALPEGASVTRVEGPANIQATDPDNNPSPRYQSLIRQQNAEQVDKAQATGRDVVVPPLVGGGSALDEPEVTVTPATTDTQTAQAPPERPPVDPKALAAALKDVAKGWALTGSGAIAGAPAIRRPVGQEATRGSVEDTLPDVPLMEVQHGVLDVGVNTDYPAQVVAHLTSGPLRGARFLGNVQAANSEVQDRAVLRFNKMVFENKTYTVSAMAVDPGTRIPAIEGRINHHIIHNTISTVASSYLLGYATGISQGNVGSVGVVVPLNPTGTVGAGGETGDAATGTRQVATTPGTGAVLRGEAARVVGGQLGRMKYRGPTVTIDAGNPVGIVITSPPMGGASVSGPRMAGSPTKSGAEPRAPAPTAAPTVTTVNDDGTVVSVGGG